MNDVPVVLEAHDLTAVQRPRGAESEVDRADGRLRLGQHGRLRGLCDGERAVREPGRIAAVGLEREIVSGGEDRLDRALSVRRVGVEVRRAMRRWDH